MYKIKARHRLSFHTKGKPDFYLGDLVSYDDIDTPISSSLCVYNYVRFDDYQVRNRTAILRLVIEIHTFLHCST